MDSTMIAANNAGQYLGHFIQLEVPIERLKYGNWQAPHSFP